LYVSKQLYFEDGVAPQPLAAAPQLLVALPEARNDALPHRRRQLDRRVITHASQSVLMSIWPD